MNINNENKIFGFGIIGTGAIASIHAKAIQAIPNAKLVGAYNKTYSKAVSFAGEFQCGAFENLDDLLNLPELDVVCICTASGAHEEPALKAIAAGKHCLIEKPLEVTLEKCDRIIEAAREGQVKLGVIFPSRFYPESKKLKSAIDAGRFGELAIGSAYVKRSRTPEYYTSAAWRGTWELDGGGALMNQAIHAVDMLQWCMGPVESVQALAGNFRHKEIEVEDTVVAILKFRNGALGTLECSTALYPGFLKKLEITGTDASVVMEDSTLSVWEFRQPDEEEPGRNPAAENAPNGGVADPMAIGFFGHQKQIEDFIEAVALDKKPLIDGEEGRKSVEIIRAIYESAQTRKVVELPRS